MMTHYTFDPRFIDHIPPAVRRKVTELAEQWERESDHGEEEGATVHFQQVALERQLPAWPMVACPQAAYTWVYTGGSLWLGYSYGDLFLEPVDPEIEIVPPVTPRAAWVITDPAGGVFTIWECSVPPRTEGEAS